MGVLELELVNRAIEEVRSEVEREKRKLSRIGDEEYAPTISSSSSSSKMGVKRVSPAAVASHLAYDPGSYQMTSATDYNPTPRSSKYTLDSDNQEHTASSMEYVPTSVAKASVKKPFSRMHTPQLPSPPPKYSTNVSSPKCKYTLDTSKPSTDMEYDPLSNFSSRIAGKKERTEGSEFVNKKRKLSGTGKSPMDEEYVPTVKKPRHQSIVTQKYTLSVSESDEESSGTEYRPTSLKRLQHKKGSSVSREDAVKVAEKESTEVQLSVLKQKSEDPIVDGDENLENQEGGGQENTCVK
ncbi:RNA exonuclease 1 homolog [Aplochiton taeniatus]